MRLTTRRTGRQVWSRNGPKDPPVNDLLERLIELDRHLMAMLESAYLRALGR